MTTSTRPRTTRNVSGTEALRTQRAARAWQDGVQHQKAGRHVQARAAFERAAHDAPGEALYWINLARSERSLGAAQACEHAALRATELDPAQWAYCQFLLERLQSAKAYSAVLAALDRHAGAVTEASLPAGWHLARGEALMRLGHAEQAIEPCMQALVLANTAGPGEPDQFALRRSAAMMLGHSLAALRRHAEAAICFRMALDSDPAAIGAALYAVHYAAWSCDWAELGKDFERLERAYGAVQRLPADAPMQDLSPFCLLGLSDDPARMRWTAEHTAVNRSAPATPRDTGPVPRPDGRLRLGLLSSDFHHHATSVLLVQALEHIDRDRFELHFYSGSPDDGSALRQRILATARQVHDVRQWSAERLAEQIRTDQIGVLFDLKGFTSNQRLDVMAHRPAPLQVAWLGYPGTSGAACIDYIIGDPVVTPLAHAEHFTEAIAQMPHSYQPNDGLRSRPLAWRRAECGLPDHATVFASFNQSYKTTPDVFAAWCRILAAVPDAVLWLMVPDADTQARLRTAAAACGIDATRIVFAPFIGIESHRARLPQADLILDTFPCSGHTTSSDALWAGVPVLTRPGRTFASRVSASLLHTLGLDELICTDPDDYVACGIALGRDAGARTALRARLAEAIRTSPLFDGARFAADFTALIERMAARQDAGLPPAALAA
ncbi:MAG: hypothetical protein RLY71_911 [Pseudomonadota bacterium]|jgi:predicted O-linked N-acetylglucosamine transferase (SPINDLY family)